METLYTLAVEAELAGGGHTPAEAQHTCDQCASPSENAWRTFRERLIADLDGSEWSTSEPPRVIAEIMTMTRKALSTDSCTVYLSNGHGHRVFRDRYNSSDAHRMETSRLAALTGPAARVVEQRSPLVFNAESDWAAYGIGDRPSFSGTNAKVLCVPIEAGDRVLGAIEVVRHDGNRPFAQSEFDTARVIGAMAGITIENAQLRQSMEEGYRSTIRALASAIDAKDPYTCGHSQSVAQYSLITGMILNLPADSIRMLETGALLHDIGKIGIDDAILRKPRRLTAAEHAIIRDHPVIGAAIVHDIGALNEVLPLILHHHESYDGTGYPHGLKGEDIPLGARIIAVSDAFDSMTTDRPYRRAMTINEALSELHRCRGVQFCPTALDAFAVGFSRYYDDLPRRPRVLERQERVAVSAY